MVAPLILLAIPATALGWFAGPIRHLLSGKAPASIGFVEHVPILLALAGVAVSFLLYWGPRATARRAVMLRNPVVRTPYVLFKQLWYFDHLGMAVMYVFGVGPSFFIAAFDRYVVDGLVNGVASLCRWFGRRWRGLSTGNAQAYMLTFVVALVLGLVALQAMGG